MMLNVLRNCKYSPVNGGSMILKVFVFDEINGICVTGCWGEGVDWKSAVKVKLLDIHHYVSVNGESFPTLSWKPEP